jgi:DNA-binding helix-hairpin-helix protein with protein kinase domain
MSVIYVAGQRVTLNPKLLIGKGGEADVYDPDGSKQIVVKVFKEPGHADYTGDLHAQKGASERLRIHQRKLPAFPKDLPREVVAPVELARDKTDHIVGYTMPFLSGMEVLMRYADRTFRQAGIDPNDIPQIFARLHLAVKNLHRGGVVLGDFNDLNVMVQDTDVRLVDADSYQFTANGEALLCTTFTQKFVDPRICDPHASSLVMCQPHSETTDWYAFAVMLMNCLLYVDPYGGVYKPKDAADASEPRRAPAPRITVFLRRREVSQACDPLRPAPRYPAADVLPDLQRGRAWRVPTRAGHGDRVEELPLLWNRARPRDLSGVCRARER